MTDSQERVWAGRCAGLGGQGRGQWRKHRRGLGIGGGKAGGERQPPRAGVGGKAADCSRVTETAASAKAIIIKLRYGTCMRTSFALPRLTGGGCGSR